MRVCLRARHSRPFCKATDLYHEPVMCHTRLAAVRIERKDGTIGRRSTSFGLKDWRWILTMRLSEAMCYVRGVTD